MGLISMQASELQSWVCAFFCFFCFFGATVHHQSNNSTGAVVLYRVGGTVWGILCGCDAFISCISSAWAKLDSCEATVELTCGILENLSWDLGVP